jgi:hypothetical protein
MPNLDGVEACAAPRHRLHIPKASAPSDPGPPFQVRDTLCRRSERVLEESSFECTCQ